jgi:effector-binding domain-containing protein
MMRKLALLGLAAIVWTRGRTPSPPERAAAAPKPTADQEKRHKEALNRGRAAIVVHRGPYERMSEAHDALQAHCEAHGLVVGGVSWEIYGDHKDDPAELETTIVYLLA